MTLPTEPRFTPPSPYDPTLADGFWHGNNALAVYLQAHGRLGTHGNRRKMIWYRENHDWRDDRPWPRLVVSAHRLDKESDATVYTDRPGNASLAKGFSVMMHILVMPEPGCWQISGNHEGDYLSFVVWVE